MLFVTRQPKKVINHLINGHSEYRYKKSFSDIFRFKKRHRATPIRKKFGFHPIFVSSINNDEDLIFSALTSNPSCIESYIVFETEDFEKISFQKWIDYLGNKNKSGNIELEEGEEPEYIVKSIRLDQVKKIIPVKRRFNKEQDIRYLLSEDFYKQIPLFEKNRSNLGEKIKLKDKQFDAVFKNFVLEYGSTNYREQAIKTFRSDIKKILKNSL